MALDFTVITSNWDYFLWGRTFQGETGGLLLTVLIALAAGGLALVLGIAMALAAWLGSRPRRTALTLQASLVRGVPLVFVIFWIYFLVPALFHAPIPGALSVILALAWFSSGAVMFSTLAGLESLPRGHTEAGLASGLSRSQVFASILLPQALRNLMPPMSRCSLL
jgi:polar amino acid transport system permease protein